MGLSTPRPDDIIDLTPTRAADGTLVWVPPTCPPASTSATEVVVTPGGDIAVAGDPENLSTLPRERMAASNGSWDRIINSIQAAEGGHQSQDEVVVQPGGALVPVRRGTAGAQLSKLPQDRMAAGRATPADLTEARRLDPGDVEGWQFVEDPIIPGLRFTLRPVAEPFTFFCFRAPSQSGRWYVSVLRPNLDGLTGHEHHVIHLTLGGGDKVPVVCKASGDSSHASIAEVRGTAAKFAFYHSLRRHGHVPFSA